MQYCICSTERFARLTRISERRCHRLVRCHHIRLSPLSLWLLYFIHHRRRHHHLILIVITSFDEGLSGGSKWRVQVEGPSGGSEWNMRMIMILFIVHVVLHLHNWWSSTYELIKIEKEITICSSLNFELFFSYTQLWRNLCLPMGNCHTRMGH